MTLSVAKGVSLVWPYKEIKINLSNGGSVLTVGVSKAYYYPTYTGTVRGWKIVGDTSGSIVVRILKKNNAVPTNADVISGSEHPSLSSQTLNQDFNLTTWTDREIRIDDVFGLEIASASTLTNVTISLLVE